MNVSFQSNRVSPQIIMACVVETYLNIKLSVKNSLRLLIYNIYMYFKTIVKVLVKFLVNN